MQAFTYELKRSLVPVIGQLGLWAALAGCSMLGTQSDSALTANTLGLDAVPLPDYQVGTKFVYSDGTWERVIEKESGWVKWVNQRKNVSVGSPDITYKRSSWQTSKRHGSRTFKQTEYVFGRPTTTIWPLAVGNMTIFDETGRWFSEDGQEHRYKSSLRCKVEGTEKVAVAAGDFQTWKITCAKYPDSFRYPRARPREYRTWYYAPAIGHWVLEIRDHNGFKPNGRKELVAVVPDLTLVIDDEEELRQVRKQFQNVLEYHKKDIPNILPESKNRMAMTLTPKRTFKRPGGAVCRQYTQHITVEGSENDYFGIACRDTEGGWRIPRL